MRITIIQFVDLGIFLESTIWIANWHDIWFGSISKLLEICRYLNRTWLIVHGDFEFVSKSDWQKKWSLLFVKFTFLDFQCAFIAAYNSVKVFEFSFVKVLLWEYSQIFFGNHCFFSYDFDLVSHGNERTLAINHLKILKQDDVVVYDRGYFSYVMLNRYNESKIHAVFRLQKNAGKVINEFILGDKTDLVVTIVPPKSSTREIKLKNPEIEIIP